MPTDTCRRVADSDDALSNVLDSVLLVALTVILCAVLLAILLGMIPEIEFKIFNLSEEKVPEILAITDIYHDNPDGKITYASRIKILHIGAEDLLNSDYSAKLYVNGNETHAKIETLNGYQFIKTKHYDVGQLAGPGVRGNKWEPTEWALVNFGDRTIKPNDNVELIIIRNKDKEIISRSFMKAPPIYR